MDDDYKKIDEFECNGKNMVTIRIGNSAHVMTIEDLHLMYGRMHPERWENGNRVKRNRKIA